MLLQIVGTCGIHFSYQIKSAWERSREQQRCWHDTTLQLCSGRGETELAYLLTAGPEWGSPSVSLPHICTFSLIRHMHSLVKQSSSFRNSQHLQWSLLMPPWKPYWNRIHTVMVLKSTAFGEEDKSGRLRSGTNVLMNKNEGIVRTKQERTTHLRVRSILDIKCAVTLILASMDSRTLIIYIQSKIVCYSTSNRLLPFSSSLVAILSRVPHPRKLGFPVTQPHSHLLSGPHGSLCQSLPKFLATVKD